MMDVKSDIKKSIETALILIRVVLWISILVLLLLLTVVIIQTLNAGNGSFYIQAGEDAYPLVMYISGYYTLYATFPAILLLPGLAILRKFRPALFRQSLQFSVRLLLVNLLLFALLLVMYFFK